MCGIFFVCVSVCACPFSALIWKRKREVKTPFRLVARESREKSQNRMMRSYRFW